MRRKALNRVVVFWRAQQFCRLILILTVGLAPLPAEAQPAAKMYRIGVLAIAVRLTRHRLRRRTGKGSCKGCARSATSKGRTSPSSSEAQAGGPSDSPSSPPISSVSKVDLIFARGPEAVQAAKSATQFRSIPIVAIDLESDPVAARFVASLAKPGGNVTGTFLDLAELSGKQLQLLKEMVPKLSRIAVLGHPAVNASQLRAVEVAAATLGMQVQILALRDAKDLGTAFETATRGRAGALFILSSPLSVLHRTQIGDLALKHHLPAMSVYRPHVEAGGLMSYGPNLSDMFRHCGVYVGRILRGAKPADLPIERPTKFELVINLKTAKALGLTIQPSLLLQADQVVE